jgi:predicted PurR-regulated permease PerM
MADLFVAKRTSDRRVADTPSSAPDIRAVLRVVCVVLAVAGALWLVYELRTFLLMLVFAVLFAYLVAPLVAFLQGRLVIGRGRREGSRALAVALAYLVIFGALSVFVVWVAPRVADAVRQAPELMRASNAAPLSAVYGTLQKYGVSPSMIARAVSAAGGAFEATGQQIATAFVHSAAYLPWLVVIPIVSFFLLKDAQFFSRATMGLLPSSWRVHAPALLDRIDTALAAYIRAQLVACLIVGGLVAAGFTLLRVPFAAVLGMTAGLAEFVPLAGPLAIAVVSAAIASFHSPITALGVLLFLGVLRVVEDYVIYPRLIGSTVHLHPLLVILAVLAGAELGGVAGVLLSVPLLAIGSAVYRYAAESGMVGNNVEDPVVRAPIS